LKPWQSLVLLLLFVNLISEISSTATCPCVDGGQWKYKGRQQSYCTNPNNGRTSWCAATVGSDGEYKKFSYCEGEELTACTALQDALEPSTCPCVAGGSWRFKGKLQSYCSNPSGSKMDWCATEVSTSGSFNGNFEWCTDDVKKACDALIELKPEPTCPCVSGGQWKFEGKKYSYCNNPGEKSRALWCPKSVNATGDYTGDFAYCEADDLQACKEMEGLTPPKAQCPCVEGGQWNSNEVSHSYCEDTPWCATETDENGKYVGKFAMCEGKVAESCGLLHSITTEEGKNTIFEEFTEKSTGCPCWFDLKRTDCACCKDGDEVLQCGAPMHQYCYKKTEGRQRGCPGVPSAQWTLSNTGHPCVWNNTRTDCAWCARGGSQCGDDDTYGPSSPHGAQCVDPKSEICDSMPGDCRHMNLCDPEAECVFSRKWGVSRSLYTCKCLEGWTGNGLQCVNATTGEASKPSISDDVVAVEIGITTDFYIFPHNSSEFPVGQPEKTLLDDMKDLFSSGDSCDSTPGCNATMVSTVTIK